MPSVVHTEILPHPLSKFVYYPGLNPTERRLIVANPVEALKVYRQKNEAEDMTSSVFPDQGRNDESDAFRHYVWAGLLVKALGKERAMVYLDAHEDDPRQPMDEKMMDDQNNRIGVAAGETLLKKKRFSNDSLRRSALADLRKGKLTVMTPRLKIPEEAE